MTLRPGSWPWLLRFELLVAWRNWIEQSGLVIGLVAIVWLILHAVAAFAMRAIAAGGPPGGTGLVYAGLGFWFAMTLVLSTALMLSVNALYDRGDLDLLVSSPLRTGTIFAVRGIGVALNSIAFFAGLLLPFAHMGIVYGRWGLLAVYPVLASAALGAAGVAFALTLMLVRCFGARRTRVLGQILGAFIGASLFLATQIPNLLPDAMRERWLAALPGLVESPWLDASSPLWWPVRAGFGEPVPLLATAAAGAGLFVLVMRATSRAFIAGTQESATTRARRASGPKPLRFLQGLARNVMAKELRLIRRDPNLIAKTLLSGLYLLPMILLLARNGDLAGVLAPVIIVLLASVAGNLAWITIAGEEAPDLVGSAPVDRERVRWFKAAAAVKPLAWIALPVALFYLLRAPWTAVVFVLFVALALAAAAVTQVWGGKPAPERDLKVRQKQNMGLNFVELLSTIAIAGACYLAMQPSVWALLPLPFGLLGPAVAWGMRQRDVV